MESEHEGACPVSRRVLQVDQGGKMFQQAPTVCLEREVLYPLIAV